MKNLILLFCLLFFSPFCLFGQDLVEKSSSEDSLYYVSSHSGMYLSTGLQLSNKIGYNLRVEGIIANTISIGFGYSTASKEADDAPDDYSTRGQVCLFGCRNKAPRERISSTQVLIGVVLKNSWTDNRFNLRLGLANINSTHPHNFTYSESTQGSGLYEYKIGSYSYQSDDKSGKGLVIAPKLEMPMNENIAFSIGLTQIISKVANPLTLEIQFLVGHIASYKKKTVIISN